MKRPSRRQITHAVSRNTARRAASLRLVRTIVLGAVATLAALVWLGEQYGIERDVMLSYAATTLLFVGVLALLGLAGAAVLLSVRWLVSRGRSDGDQP